MLRYDIWSFHIFKSLKSFLSCNLFINCLSFHILSPLRSAKPTYSKSYYITNKNSEYNGTSCFVRLSFSTFYYLYCISFLSNIYPRAYIPTIRPYVKIINSPSFVLVMAILYFRGSSSYTNSTFIWLLINSYIIMNQKY